MSEPITDWSGDSERWPEEKKLASLHPDFRVKVERVLADMRAEGWDPFVNFGWRDVRRQAELVAAGRSKVMFSFHNSVDINGHPAALAVDIASKKHAWGNMDFFYALGRIGKRHGLVWGGDWKTFKDYPHLQGAPNSDLARLRDRGLSAIGYAADVGGSLLPSVFGGSSSNRGLRVLGLALASSLATAGAVWVWWRLRGRRR